MTDIKRKLYALVQKGESAEVEFKSARGGFPGSFWESYSAFANTNGGTIILGVQEKDGKFLFDGLSEETVLKYKKNFWDNAHNRGKVSVCLPHEQDVEVKEVNGAYLLVCHIPGLNTICALCTSRPTLWVILIAGITKAITCVPMRK